MIDFPNNPVVGQEHSAGERTWVFLASQVWRLKASGTGNLRSLAELQPNDADIIEFNGTTGEWEATRAPREIFIDGGNF